MDEASGTTKPGYKISKGADNYEIYDRWNHQLVQRTHNGITEVGKFEYSFVLNSDGTIGLDMEHPGALVEGKIYYNATDGGKAQFGVAEKNVQEVRLEVPSDSVKPSPGYTIDPITNKILNGILHLPNLWLDITIDNGKVENSDGTPVPSSDILGELTPQYYVYNGLGGGDHSNLCVRSGLSDKGINPDCVHPVSVFDTVFDPTNFVVNGNKWLEDREAWMVGHIGELTQKTINQMKSVFDSMSLIDKKAPQVAISYSGATPSLLRALVSEPSLIIDTLISYAGPLGAGIPSSFAAASPRLKTFINVWGSADEHADNFKVFGGTWGKQDLAVGVKTFNIEINGARHMDFWYDEAENKEGYNTPEQKEMNRKVADFMVRLSIAASGSPSELDDFLRMYETPSGVYEVNL